MLTHHQILRAVQQLQERASNDRVRTSDLANWLRVTGPSATARIQELAAAGLLTYVPRQGASLSEEGKRQAQRAVKRMQMIEQFLRDVLELPVESISTEAEFFDRFASEKVVEGIARFLAGQSSV